MDVVRSAFPPWRSGIYTLQQQSDLTESVDSPSIDSTMSSSLWSIRSLARIAFTSAAQLALGPYSTGASSVTSLASCPSPQLSCHNSTPVANTCCFNAPGGLLLQTQFWDTQPATGPVNSWTVHGLWPDLCDGSFEQYCDRSREYSNISEIIRGFGRDTLLDYMSTYWKDYQGKDDSFWEHEWNKHGTCVSTLEPSCYGPDYVPQAEVVDFFQRTVDVFKELDTYKALAAAGITPSSSATYTTAAIQTALAKISGGHAVTLRCRSGALNEVWYYFNVRGNVQSGEFVTTDPDGSKSTCPDTGIKYLPKKNAVDPSDPVTSPTTTTTTTGVSVPPSSTATTTPFTGTGQLIVHTDGSPSGCIISTGKWLVGQTCATFRATALSSSSATATNDDGFFTLVSSKGDCAFVAGALVCSREGEQAAAFTVGLSLLL
ncbi:MAG: hypothetical protein M1825_006334 [Sarcosagium campestre]|nr:MAG: hypothetical protein M1825_006334 [Sarcosagium campestre]